MKTTVAVLSSLAFAFSAFARIGDTLEQSIKRYGPVQECHAHGLRNLIFYKFERPGGIYIWAGLDDEGNTKVIEYTRSYNGSFLRVAEVQSILEEESTPGSSWVSSELYGRCDRWDNGTCIATYCDLVGSSGGRCFELIIYANAFAPTEWKN